MAFQLNFTDEYGVNYPASYWHCVQTNLSKADLSGRLTFYGFQDAANKGKRIIGQKNYTILAADYNTYFSATAVDPLNVNHISQAYVYASATLDVDSGQKDDDGKPVMASFFNGSTEV